MPVRAGQLQHHVLELGGERLDGVPAGRSIAAGGAPGPGVLAAAAFFFHARDAGQHLLLSILLVSSCFFSSWITGSYIISSSGLRQ
uniref:Uncharacterized protein n=1 Tax=Arundo donax TaxID=35708 RepID=A0A0A9GK11_ARUDO